MGLFSKLLGQEKEQPQNYAASVNVVCAPDTHLSEYLYHYNGVEKTEAELKSRMSAIEFEMNNLIVVDPNDLYTIFDGNVTLFEAYKTSKGWNNQRHKSEYEAIKEKLLKIEAARIPPQPYQPVIIPYQPQPLTQSVNQSPPIYQPQTTFVQLQETYKSILTEQVAWQEEKEKLELTLQRDKEQWAYDLAIRRIEMEQQLKEYEMHLKDQSLTQQQQIEIERLKLEIDNLKMQLDYRQ